MPEDTNLTSCFENGSTADQSIDCMFEGLANLAESTILYSIDFTLTSSSGTVSEHSLPLLIIWLGVAGLIFSLYFAFVNIRYFKHAVDVVRGKFDEEGTDGQISNFQALAASLSGTVGLGNIAGVAVAISMGGPGAVVWMTLMGLFGMNTKFVEVALGVKYRTHADKENLSTISGGPMYYLKQAFVKHNLPKVGAVFAALFAICCIGGSIGGGNMFQANQAFEQFLFVTGGEDSWFNGRGWVFGVGLALLTGLVILGGIESIANVASKLVPAMGGLYLVSGLIVIAMSYQAIPEAFSMMFTDAFTPAAGLGGFVGGLLAGVQRASFSNEAGLGSAAIVHSAAKTEYPVRQGFVGMLGPFIDTIVICNVTALVIIISGVYQDTEGLAGVDLTSKAFADGISWFPYVLAVTVFLFAYSTLLTWYYNGEKALAYLLGERASVRTFYKIVFLFFIVIGASAQLSNVVRFSDAMLFSMGIPNLIGLYMLAPEIKRDLKAYKEKFFAK